MWKVVAIGEEVPQLEMFVNRADSQETPTGRAAMGGAGLLGGGDDLPRWRWRAKSPGCQLRLDRPTTRPPLRDM